MNCRRLPSCALLALLSVLGIGCTANWRTPAPIPIPGPTPTATLATNTATVPCTYSWFFPNPPADCPGQPPVYSLTVVQHFEQGFMLWRQDPDSYGSQIYTFFTDNLWPYWNPSNDWWRQGMPESDPSIVPPPGYFQPVRGLGELWRTRTIPRGSDLVTMRERLGWATEEEYALGELALQCHTNDSRQNGCYVAGPDGSVYAIYPDNSWILWRGQTATP